MKYSGTCLYLVAYNEQRLHPLKPHDVYPTLTLVATVTKLYLILVLCSDGVSNPFATQHQCLFF